MPVEDGKDHSFLLLHIKTKHFGVKRTMLAFCFPSMLCAVMNFQSANEKSRKIGKQELAGKYDRFVLALRLARGELESADCQTELPGKEN